MSTNRALLIGSQTGGLTGVHSDVEVVDDALRGLGFTTHALHRARRDLRRDRVPLPRAHRGLRVRGCRGRLLLRPWGATAQRAGVRRPDRAGVVAVHRPDRRGGSRRRSLPRRPRPGAEPAPAPAHRQDTERHDHPRLLPQRPDVEECRAPSEGSPGRGRRSDQRLPVGGARISMDEDPGRGGRQRRHRRHQPARRPARGLLARRERVRAGRDDLGRPPRCDDQHARTRAEVGERGVDDLARRHRRRPRHGDRPRPPAAPGAGGAVAPRPVHRRRAPRDRRAARSEWRTGRRCSTVPTCSASRRAIATRWSPPEAIRASRWARRSSTASSRDEPGSPSRAPPSPPCPPARRRTRSR